MFEEIMDTGHISLERIHILLETERQNLSHSLFLFLLLAQAGQLYFNFTNFLFNIH
ncbi:hypothetical protein ACV1D8_12540 [Aeromonas caviae]